MRRLLIRPGAIGDCLLSFPALEFLAADYTEVWLPSAVVPLVRFANLVRPLAQTGIDLVAIGEREIAPGLRDALIGFDSVVSWYGTNRPEFRETLMSLGPSCEFHAALPPTDSDEHATDFFARQVGAPLNLVTSVVVEAELHRDTIVIHPFSGSTRKNWPLNSFRELAKSLPLRVEWIAGPEEELADAVRFDDLLGLGRWLAGARLYVGNDSGITHLAAAIGIPTVAIFLTTDSKLWAPRGRNVTVLERPTVDEVWRTINGVL